ncbi:carbohydrate ABC transporter permease [Glycomyces scopariae]|uniref:Multiple sugar transport system permease protein n=1 Tax=Glycomyces sambucus TaxID=380244 RepID=A0A1G9FBJ1_9ACTN|nr:carbohydrate ABC transporter permease [Glycomyces sambucus]SDK85769.1 multiple sugar transport system permease protein [Glycomyces sambucus]
MTAATTAEHAAAEPRVVGRRQRTGAERGKSVLWHLCLLASLVVVLYPAFWVLTASIKPNADIITDLSPIPTTVTWENFASAFDGLAGVPLWRFFWNSFVIAALSVVGIVVSCSITAYALGRLEFPGRKAMFAVVIATLLLPGQVMLIPQYLIFSELDVVNTIFPLVIGKFLALDAFFVFMYIQFLRGIPRELDQAATIDGAGHFRIFFSIMLPLLRPAIVTSSIFTFIGSWNDFMGPLIYLHEIEKFPLPRLLQSYNNTEAVSNYGGMMAMTLLSLVPVVLFFLVFQKFLIKGIATSGVKG